MYGGDGPGEAALARRGYDGGAAARLWPPQATSAREPPVTELLTTPSAAVDQDHLVVLHGATWADYQRLLELRGEGSTPRLTYLEGRLELMSPGRRHELVASMIGRLVEAWCLETGVGITPYGRWTLERKELERGCEPDECYVLGAEDEPALPDLAIEVIVTSGGLSKLDVYRPLGVREVWFWRAGVITLHALRRDRYEAIPRSEVLPGLDLDLLLRFLDVRPMTRAVEEFRAALRARGAGAP